MLDEKIPGWRTKYSPSSTAGVRSTISHDHTHGIMNNVVAHALVLCSHTVYRTQVDEPKSTQVDESKSTQVDECKSNMATADDDKRVSKAIFDASRDGNLSELKKLLEVPRSSAVLDAKANVSGTCK